METAFSKQIFFLPLSPTLTFTDSFSVVFSSHAEGRVQHFRGKSCREHVPSCRAGLWQDDTALFLPPFEDASSIFSGERNLYACPIYCLSKRPADSCLPPLPNPKALLRYSSKGSVNHYTQ